MGTHVLPTYVLPLPGDINRFICTFLPHPDTKTRNLRARHVIEHLHQKVVQLMFELDMLEGMQEHIYEEEEGVFAMQPLLHIEGVFLQYWERPTCVIDTLMRSFKYYKSGWYARSIEPFAFPMRLQVELQFKKKRTLPLNKFIFTHAIPNA